MELRDLIEHVGEERFAAAREWAWGTAANTGKGGSTTPTETPPLYKPQEVPHDLEDLVWSAGEAAWVERVGLAFELYREVPCYATLMYTTGYHARWAKILKPSKRHGARWRSLTCSPSAPSSACWTQLDPFPFG